VTGTRGNLLEISGRLAQVLELEEIQGIYQSVIQFLVQYSFQIVGALIIVGIGYLISRKLSGSVERLMLANHIDVTLSRFVANSLYAILLTLVVLIALGKLGVSITPLIAAVGAVSLGAGLALQGMLANYAAGFTIIITRPFVVGDTVLVQGVSGVVDKVTLPYTLLVDEDKVHIQIPNRLIVGEILHNSAAEKLVELKIGVAYQSNPQEVKEVISKALVGIEGVSEDRPALIGIDNYGDSSINFGVRFWAPTQAHFQTRYAANLAIFEALAQAGISIPFPQREVRYLGKENEVVT
jgi:small conductance mechanosensitive channel